MKKLIALFSILIISTMLSGCLSAIQMAAYNGDINRVKEELDKGANVDEGRSSDKTPLAYASLKGDINIVKLLLDKGADVNAICFAGWTPLSMAASRGRTDVMTLLVERGANVDRAIVALKDNPSNDADNARSYLYELRAKFKQEADYKAKLAELKEFEAIARQYREAKKKPSLPEDARKFKVQAEFAAKNRKYVDAVNLYADALKLCPWWPAGHYNRALVLTMLKTSDNSNYQDAIIEMKKYLMLVPNAPDARAAQDKIYQWESMVK
jgi:tetratricopeptide (TPR) repeat protein